MREVAVNLPNKNYSILIGDRGLKDPRLLQLIEGRSLAIVTDETVGALYSNEVIASLQTVAAQVLLVQLPLREATKSWENVNQIVSSLLEARFDRKSVILALGGGVVGDVAGFAAAIYQRGIDFIQMPTTLLSMVDSSVGGKTGINHAMGKNMIGAFYQPQLVVAHLPFLTTLPAREVSAGLAEIIKHGAIVDVAYLDRVAKAMPRLRNLELDALADVIARSCEIKAAVVSADEREAGVRAHLNFGHTFGHAIEAGMGYGEWLHGEAVGAGMVIASDLSQRLDLLSTSDQKRLVEIIKSAGLPVVAPSWAPERYIELMTVDKKSVQGVPKFILLNGLGAAVFRHVPNDLLTQTLVSCTV